LPDWLNVRQLLACHDFGKNDDIPDAVVADDNI
jgi:hypothetical protein